MIKVRQRISVAMATYNGEQFISSQLDSILTQLSENDEIIISDDGSKDNTISIINSYISKDPRIKLVPGPGRGVIKNFENAINHTTGDIIFLCDQDDVWKNNKVNVMLKCFAKTGAYVVLHDARIVDENDCEIEQSFFKFRGSKKGMLNNIKKNSYHGCCMAFDKILKGAILPIPDKIEMHDWWIGMLGEKCGKTAFVNDKLIDYRRHSKNVTTFHHHKFTKMLFNRLYLVYQLMIRKVII